MLKRPLRIRYHQGALTTRSNYKENWYAKTFPYEEGPNGPFIPNLFHFPVAV